MKWNNYKRKVLHAFDFKALILLLLFSKCSSQPSSTIPLNSRLHDPGNHSAVSAFLSESDWNTLFPNRYGIGIKDSITHFQDFYSYKSFIEAASLFPSFVNEGDENTRKRELAAFLANIAQETSGGWANAPGGYFKWGLYFLNEQQIGQANKYSDPTKTDYPPAPGKAYYGRGPKQLSWNYNYGQFSKAWYDNADTLLEFPERLSTDPVLSFASAIWFWMTPQPPKPSCHDIMTGKWQPTPDDLTKGRKPGFGATVNVINGGVECNGSKLDKTTYRYEYYQFFCSYFHVDPGPNITCTDQRPFNQ